MKLQPKWSLADHNRATSQCLHGKIVYCPQDSTAKEDLSYILSTLHIIGFDTSASSKTDGAFTFTSLGDGMTNTYSLEKLLDILNSQPYIPISSSLLQRVMQFKVPLL